MTKCKHCVNCFLNEAVNTPWKTDEHYICIKGLSTNVYEHEECIEYINENKITLNSTLYWLYKDGFGLIVFFTAIILFLSQMPWFATLILAMIITFGIWIKSN